MDAPVIHFSAGKVIAYDDAWEFKDCAYSSAGISRSSVPNIVRRTVGGEVWLEIEAVDPGCCRRYVCEPDIYNNALMIELEADKVIIGQKLTK